MPFDLITVSYCATEISDLRYSVPFRSVMANTCIMGSIIYRGADKSLVRPGKKQATATEDFDVHISYL